jgi:hypothetical protein
MATASDICRCWRRISRHNRICGYGLIIAGVENEFNSLKVFDRTLFEGYDRFFYGIDVFVAKNVV